MKKREREHKICFAYVIGAAIGNLLIILFQELVRVPESFFILFKQG